ncbi:MAG: deoxyuridine 5'-triphosphate nucleotidohydrolase [Candidatus Aminicenantes bacterium RBG_13_63_10]|nr:MAG: deoxyuridine 5'-triphosphate nucleotidohydrolase [Candidatus Aminicenantes bacterium RBG_13_63_10]
MKLKAQRIHPQAKLPVYGHPGDAGLDLFSCGEASLGPGEVKAVPTGLRLAIPRGFVGLIWDKSGLSLQGVHRLAGVVDAGYRGEVRVVLANLGRDVFVVKAGMKVAQLLIQPVQAAEVEEAGELEDTPRGEGGFGSTGLY